MHFAYFDNNSTTQILPEVLEEMIPCFTESFGNPSSIHDCGRRALANMKLARVRVAALLGCLPTEIVFTSGGTEGDNLVLKGMISPGDHLIVSAIEHSAILGTGTWLEHFGCEVTRVGVNGNGQVEPDSVRRALRSNTRLISVMMANNETGVLQPLVEISRIASEADVWFHTDAVQAVGKVPVSVNEIGCDLLTISAHKIHGPQGVGALFVRRGTGCCAHSCMADTRREIGAGVRKMWRGSLALAAPAILRRLASPMARSNGSERSAISLKPRS